MSFPFAVAVPDVPSSSSFLDDLNPEQVTVVTQRDGAVFVVAVAGAGKTRVIVVRIATLVADGADPSRILALTFAVKAAKEMNTRLADLGVTGVRVGTIHSLGWEIVRTESCELRDWLVDDSDRFRYVVKDVLGRRGMDWKRADLTQVLSYITRCKAAAALPGSPQAKALAERLYALSPSPARDPILLARAYFEAEEMRRSRQLLTYDDMLLEAWSLLQDDAVSERWAVKWDYVLQDECQDENPVQREIIAKLAVGHGRCMAVGDPAQSIYGFRGSDPTGALDFASRWGAVTIKMARNYRCGRRIIAAANNVLDAMDRSTHLGVHIVAERDVEGVVTATRYRSFDEEGVGVVDRILAANVDGMPWKSNVVLYRTNAQSRGVEEALLSSRVPYAVIGGTSFYTRKEVRDLLAYVRVASGRGVFDDVKRAINTPFRYLGKVFVDGIDRASRRMPDSTSWTDIVRAHVTSGGQLQGRQKTSALEWCALVDDMAKTIQRGATSLDDEDKRAARPARMLETLVDEIDYSQWLTRDEGTESPENNRVSNVRELIRAAERFPTVDELLDYIDDTLERAQQMKRTGESADCVTLTSLHRSKGLEWPVVYLIGANQKILPHARAEDPGEERRLFYVGVTRARDELHISCVCEAAVGPRVVGLQPSQFIAEAGIAIGDHASCSQTSVDREQLVERSRAHT